MPQFDVSSFSSQLFWLVIVFSFLYLLVSKLIAPKAESILTTRNRYLEGNVKDAEAYSDKVSALQIEKEEKLLAVNKQIDDMQKQAMEILEEHFNKQAEKLDETLSRKKEKAGSEIEKYIKQFKAGQSESVNNLAAFIIEKVTNKPADMKILKKINGKIK